MPLLLTSEKMRLLLQGAGTRLWALCGFGGDVLALLSGVHFSNPARTVSMVIGLIACPLLWVWGDYGSDATIAHKPMFARMQKLAFILSLVSGLLLIVAGLDLTHPAHTYGIGADFRPVEMLYGLLIAVAFAVLAFEDKFRFRHTRKLAALCLAPCSFGAMLAGVLSHDGYVFASGVVYLTGNACLWFSTRLNTQRIHGGMD